jgi:formate hydrogenlyase subunit 4
MIMLIILKIVLLSCLAPLLIGIVRKMKAKMQNRQGASIVQPYFDIWKLFHKDEVIATDASWVFLITPYLLFGLSFALFAGVMLFTGMEQVNVFGDFILLVATLGLMAFLLSIAGMDTGSAFGGFGSSREMTLAALTEGTLFFSLLPVALVTQMTNVIAMAPLVASLPVSSYLPIFIAFLGYFIALMCETGRIPFDNAATHLELTMIHEAMILEYSGKRLALIEWASANKFLFFVMLGVNLFFPWSPDMQNVWLTAIVGVVFSLVKALVLLGVIVFVESSIAKLRLFRLPDLILTGYILGVVAIIVSGI